MILQIVRWNINLSNWLFKIRLRRAIRKANRESKEFNKKYLVISFQGRPRAYQKSSLKDLIYRRKYFKKGTTVEQLEKMAYYVTQ
ncbi:MAG: hypothetical protein WCO44_12460 [Bacteroidota bacterium]